MTYKELGLRIGERSLKHVVLFQSKVPVGCL